MSSPDALRGPVLAVTIALVCLTAGVIDVGRIDWPKPRNEFPAAVAISIPLGLLTGEAFFRGWLFGSLQHAGMSELKIVILTAVAFALWHIPAVTMNTEDAVPVAQVPVLLTNGVVIGVIWGMVRLVSGSILVTSVCHAVWNAAVYAFFGFGTTVGALGVKQTALYGPESGLWGLVLNLVVAVALLQWWKRRKANTILP